MSEPEARRRGILKRIAFALATLLASAGILLLVADGELITGALSLLAGADPWWLLPAALLVWVTFGLAAERYRRVILVLQPEASASFPFFFGIGLLTMFAAVLAPIGLAADAARAGLLPLVLRIRPGLSALAVVHDRVLGVVGIGVLGLPLLLLQPGYGVPADLVSLQAVVFGLLCAGALVLQLVIPRISAEGRILRHLHYFFASYTRQLETWPRLIGQLLIALAGIAALALLFWCLARALHLPQATFPLLLAVTPGLYLAHSMPFTYAGWGAREAAAIALLAPVPGIAPEQAVALSFAYGAILTLAALPGALVPLFLSRRRAV